MRRLQGLTALVFGLVALAASTFHLGRPRYAYRAILGLRHSWMSREILAFGLFAGLASAYAGALMLPQSWMPDQRVLPWLGIGVVIAGGAGVFGSVMIYATLGREYWSFSRTALRFLLTAGLLGTATAWLSAAVFALANPSASTDAMLSSVGRLSVPRPAAAGLA